MEFNIIFEWNDLNFVRFDHTGNLLLIYEIHGIPWVNFNC